jgi:uncharacterized OsmC-like protein
LEGAQKIKEAFERNAKALALRPSKGQGTAVTKVRLAGGMKCEVEEGNWKLTVDASPKSGGDNEGPNPGVIGRAALATCLAQAYASWAAVLGVPLTSLAVDIEADYDARGIYGNVEVPVDYSEVRYNVSIESDAPESDILAMMEKAELHCPWLQILAKPMNLRRLATISKSGRE